MRSERGGLAHLEYRRRYRDKLLFITEFCNHSATMSLADKGRQYVTYYNLLRQAPGLGAAFSFVLSASGSFPGQAWRDESGGMTEVVGLVGGRTA
jgi:hypothetical protein